MIFAFALACSIQNSDSVRLHNALGNVLLRIERLEALPLSRASALQRSTAKRQLGALLDTVVLHRRWGAVELATMQRRYPGALLLIEYDARLATQQHRFADAIAARERILRETPADTAQQRAYAEVLERAGRLADARTAYLRWFEAAPEVDAPFRALLRLQPDYQDLLERVRRMRIALPDSKMLAGHETELLYKTGRKP